MAENGSLLLDESPATPRHESRVSKFAWSAGLTWGYQGLVLFTGFWMTRFLLSRLGEEVLGWWAQALVVVGYLGMVDFGLSSLLPRAVAAEIGRCGGWQNAADLPHVVARFAKFAFWQTLLAAAGAVLCGLMLTHAEDVPVGAVLGLLAVSVLGFPLRLASGVLTGLQDVRYSGIAQVVIYLASVSVTVVSVTAGYGLAGLVLGLAVQSILMAALVWGRLAFAFRSVLPRVKDLIAARLPVHMLIDGGWAWLASVGVLLAGTADLAVIAVFYPPEVVFHYACTVKLIMVVNPIVMTLCQAVLPGLTELKASADSVRVQRATLAYTQLILGLSGLFGCVILATNAGFVSWWVGPSRYLGDTVVILAVIGMNLRHLNNAMAVTLFCSNLERPLWQLTLLDGLITFGATAGCVWWGGAECAPLGAALTVGLFTIPMAFRVASREGTVSVSDLLRAVVRWMAPCGALAVLAAMTGRFLQPENTLSLSSAALAVGGIYLVVITWLMKNSELGDCVSPWLQRIGISFQR